MHHELLIVLSLLLLVVLLDGVSTRLKLSFPILLVLVGLGISLSPALPHIALSPDVIFLIFLPPLLYEAAWFTSWREFKTMRGAIALQALGLVLFTSAAVAWVAHSYIAGCTWALGFLLGGVVSPPDAVAASSVLHGLTVPRLPVAVLEGESLVNDASSLIVVRFAMAALVSGMFSLKVAVQDFFYVSLVGIVMGLVVSRVIVAVHRKLPGTPAVDTALTLLTPYVVYLAAEQVHASGVLAVVTAGLGLSARKHRFLNSTSHVYGVGTWATVTFVLNGVVFILIGLQLPDVVRDLGDTSLPEAIAYGLLFSLVAIVVRVLWTFPAAYLPSCMPWKPKPRRLPDWRVVMLVAWAGMRGVVSLASALAIPHLADDGSPFPLRPLIIFITFVVILVTLVAQGLSLPLVVKWLQFDVHEDEALQRKTLEEKLAQVALGQLQTQGLMTLAEHFSPAVDDDATRAKLVTLQKLELVRLRDAGEVAYELARTKEFELELELARLATRSGMTH